MITGPKSTLENDELQATIAKGRDTVAEALTYLTGSSVKNFYARVINLMDRYAIPGIGTMGVTVQRGRYILAYDPLFAANVTAEEVCATCEHEVLHLILEHIPRTLMLRKTFSADEDTALFDMTSNLAVDLAVNELLARSWPKIKQADAPLGDWVTPDKYQPNLPADLSYENYHTLLLETLQQRLTVPAQQLYKLAKQVLKDQQDKMSKALNGSPDEKEEGAGKSDDAPAQPDAGEGQGDEEGEGEGEGEGGNGEGGGDGGGDGAGQGQGQGSSPEQLQQEIENLDPRDRKVLEMLINAMQKHLGWDGTQADESDLHKAQAHGKTLIKSALSSMSQKSRGTLPGHLLELIRRMLTPPTVPWTAFLHNVVQRTRQTKRMRGMSRPSKKLSALKVFANKKEEEEDPRFLRYALLRQMPVFPGIRQDNKFTIVYAVDTSASMGIAELELGFSELQHIQKADSDVSICVLYSDTHICTEYWVGPTTELDARMSGRGGTDFEPVFQHVQKLLGNSDKAPDILVYCTDGYAPPPTTRLPIPTIWLLTPRGVPVTADSGHITIMMKDYQLEDSYV